MTLKFTFFYKDSRIDYFLNAILAVAKKYHIQYAYKSNDEKLYFFANGENLGDFANALSKAIPLSLYFKCHSVEIYEKAIKFQKDIIDKNIITIDTINAIKNTQSPHFCDVFKYYERFYSHFGDSKNIINSKESLKEAIFHIVDLLKQKQTITLQTSKGKIAIFLPSNHFNFDYILASDISSISILSRASKDEIEALATFEKPAINLNIKDVFVADLHCHSGKFILPYDIILYCLSSVLLDNDILFAFIKLIDSAESLETVESVEFVDSVESVESTPLNLYYEIIDKDEFFEIVVGKNGYFLKKNFLDSSVDFATFLDKNFCQDSTKRDSINCDSTKQDSIKHDSKNCDSTDDKFISYLSLNHPTFIAKYSDKMPFVKIHFDKNPKNILQKIALLENGDRLISNFTESFRDRITLIESLNSTPKYTQNILDIFEVIAVFLGCEADKNIIFDYAKSYLRHIGPKVDFKNIDIDGEMFYNETLTIRSIMSFCLAGVERENLCFGVIESLVDYLILFFRKAQDKFCIKNIGIVGDMFANQIFFDKITEKIPSSFNLAFPKYLDISV